MQYCTEADNWLHIVSGDFSHHAQVYKNLDEERPQIHAQVEGLRQELARRRRKTCFASS